jgi:hypothetical protein
MVAAVVHLADPVVRIDVIGADPVDPHVGSGLGLGRGAGQICKGVVDQLQIDADRRQITLKQLAGVNRLLQRLLHLELDWPPHRRSFGHCFLEILLRLCQIVLITSHSFRIPLDVVWGRRRVAGGVAFDNLIDEASVIKSVGKAFPRVDVVEGRLGIVHPNQQ